MNKLILTFILFFNLLAISYEKSYSSGINKTYLPFAKIEKIYIYINQMLDLAESKKLYEIQNYLYLIRKKIYSSNLNEVLESLDMLDNLTLEQLFNVNAINSKQQLFQELLIKIVAPSDETIFKNTFISTKIFALEYLKTIKVKSEQSLNLIEKIIFKINNNEVKNFFYDNEFEELFECTDLNSEINNIISVLTMLTNTPEKQWECFNYDIIDNNDEEFWEIYEND